MATCEGVGQGAIRDDIVDDGVCAKAWCPARDFIARVAVTARVLGLAQVHAKLLPFEVKTAVHPPIIGSVAFGAIDALFVHNVISMCTR